MQIQFHPGVWIEEYCEPTSPESLAYIGLTPELMAMPTPNLHLNWKKINREYSIKKNQSKKKIYKNGKIQLI